MRWCTSKASPGFRSGTGRAPRISAVFSKHGNQKPVPTPQHNSSTALPVRCSRGVCGRPPGTWVHPEEPPLGDAMSPAGHERTGPPSPLSPRAQTCISVFASNPHCPDALLQSHSFKRATCTQRIPTSLSSAWTSPPVSDSYVQLPMRHFQKDVQRITQTQACLKQN